MAYFTPQGDPWLFRCRCGEPDCTAPPPAPELLRRLEILRGRVGLPLRVTSGPRCPAYNESQGGVPDSTHLAGTAADLACPGSRLRWHLLASNWLTSQPLFERLGIGADFIHVDVSTRNPPRVIWHYYS